jgi:DNA replication protein DnaC
MNPHLTQVEAQLEEAVIKQHCQHLRLPSVAAQFGRLAEQAAKQQPTHVRYLNLRLSAEVEDRERRVVEKRRQAARLPGYKTLEEFDFAQSPHLSPTPIQQLAPGGDLERSEPVVLIGECGTGKTHLATGWCVAAGRQKKRARFITAAGLVNELGAAQHHHQLGRVLQRSLPR